MRKHFLIFYFLLSAFCVTAQKDWQLAIQTWTFHKFPLYQAINKADSLGVKYLEVYPWQPWGIENAVYPFGPDMPDPTPKMILGYLKKRNIKIVAMGVLVKEHYKTREGIEKWFVFAQKMKIPFITAEPEWEDLDEFNRLAEKYKVKVALHCHPKPASHYWHPDSTLKAMQGRKYIGAWPDIGHWARNGVSIMEGLQKLEGRIWGLHFKDVKEFDNVKTEDTLFGKGVCDLPTVLKELKRQNFKGVVSMEYEANEYNNMEDMRNNIEFYKSKIRKLD
ncbi:MAG: sugar phosphate isomerase/epimerase [Bacteroidetes bacterium]|nr:sugar phosphate isomerase/epimerase [Bacteroidota bacterium]